MTKIDIRDIVRRHVATLRDNTDGRLSAIDVLTFFALPLGVAYVSWHFRLTLTVDALAAVLASFAIFAGLLLNVLILVYTLSANPEPQKPFTAARRRLVLELHDNIQFAVLISVVVVILALVAVATVSKGEGETVARAGRAATAIVAYLTSNFLLTLLMILKRIQRLLVDELDRPQPMRKAIAS
jgi:hypothetical protein